MYEIVVNYRRPQVTAVAQLVERLRLHFGQAPDWMELEIDTALRQGKPVIPVLFEDTPMPGRSELPGAIADLATRNAARLRASHLALDRDLLIRRLEEHVDPEETPPARMAGGVGLPEPGHGGEGGDRQACRSQGHRWKIAELTEWQHRLGPLLFCADEQ